LPAINWLLITLHYHGQDTAAVKLPLARQLPLG